jgi:hypothetical protein
MIAVASLALLGGAVAGWAEPAQPDVATRYEQALDWACQMRLEPGPDADRLYDRAHRVAPSLPDPAMAGDECFQAP